jgi:tRNA dimethylallyltransferase
VLVGPTASGKTETAIAVAGSSFEILSADSVQVYRHLDIGSGKPSKEQLQEVRHHLIDIVNPDYNFTAGDFCREADRVIDDLEIRGKLPLITGGTGLYIDAFFKGLSEIPPIDSRIKIELLAEVEARGLGALHGELRAVDPVFGGKVHPNDRQRILRGLEVYRGTGRPLGGYFEVRESRETEHTLYIGLRVERDELEKRIDRRVDAMMAAGFVEEVRRLRQMGFGPGLNSMRTIGYREINEYIDGSAGLEDAVAGIKLETRRYAKRQMTWFRKNKAVQWVPYFDVDKIRSILYKWLRDG